MLVHYMEVEESSVYGNQHVFFEKARAFVRLLTRLTFVNTTIDEDIARIIFTEATLLSAVLTRNNIYRYTISAILDNIWGNSYPPKKIIEMLCEQCMYACSEIAAADEVYIVNYQNTGKRHKLEKWTETT